MLKNINQTLSCFGKKKCKNYKINVIKQKSPKLNKKLYCPFFLINFKLYNPFIN